MPEIISQPKKKRKVVAVKKCPTCKTVAKYFHEDCWTEDGNTEARCAGKECNTIIFLGRLNAGTIY